MSNPLRSFFVLLLLLMFAACTNTPEQLSVKTTELNKLFAALEKDEAFNGVVLVTDKGKVIFKKAIGYSNFEEAKRLTLQSAFDIASISKTITAIAVHMLVEWGMLSLDDPITEFFPKLPYNTVTIRGLLSHTSGLFDVYGEKELREKFYAFYGKTDPPYGNKDYLAFLEKYKPPLIDNPGEQYKYSNTGYVLLGLVVEKVTGQEFDEFLKQNIFKPAGMEHAVVFSKLKDKKVPGMAGGYRYDQEKGVVPNPDPNAPPSMYGLTYGDDDITCTAGDLLAFDQALHSGELLKSETLNMILTPQTLNDGTISGYALGFRVAEMDNHRYITHTGGTSGFSSYCKFSRPENDNTVILFTNVTSEGSTFRAIYEAINKIMLGRPYEMPKLQISYLWALDIWNLPTNSAWPENSLC